MSDVQIRFSERPGDVSTLIEVHFPAAAKLIQKPDRVLFGLRVQILSSETLIEDARRTERYLVCELDVGPLTTQRKRELSVTLAGHLGPPRDRGRRPNVH